MVTSGGPGLGYGAADDSDEDQDGDKVEHALEDQDNVRYVTRFGSVRLVQLAGVHYLEVCVEKADESESWPQLFRPPRADTGAGAGAGAGAGSNADDDADAMIKADMRMVVGARCREPRCTRERERRLPVSVMGADACAASWRDEGRGGPPARAEAKEVKEAKEAAAKTAKAEAKAAKTAQQAAAKKAKAKARKKQAEAEAAKAAEQTQVEVAGSSGRGAEAGEVHVYTGRARRASRRATGVG
eukprot:g1855.t1